MIRLDLDALTRARLTMGAPEVDVHLSFTGLPELHDLEFDLSHDRKEVDLNDIETTGAGLLSYSGYQVVLYIPDQAGNIFTVEQDGTAGKRYHVAECGTLERMRAQNRFERYIARNGLSPRFRVHGKARSGARVDNVEAELRVCRNCLRRLNYKGFATEALSKQQREQIVEDFDMESFFARYSSYFRHIPHELKAKYAPETYPDRWRDISREAYQRAGWQCTSCGVNLKRAPGLLHAHHVNGDRSDNRADNLRVRCLDCHAKSSSTPMSVRYKDKQKIHRMRRTQGIFPGARSESRVDEIWKEVYELADPAVHDVLSYLEACGDETPPDVGVDLLDDESEVVCLGELVWEAEKKALVIDMPDATGRQRLARAGWTLLTAADILHS